MNSIGYEIVLPGIGASTNRGALGWCNIVLIKAQDKLILFDTGSNEDREELLLAMEKRGLTPADVDLVFISHLHYDHCCNIEIFESAQIVVSKRELEYALSGEYKKYSDPYIPDAVVRYFEKRFTTVEDQQEIAEGIKVIALPGHTPGSAGLLLEKEGILIAGDAVKNAWDFTCGNPPRAIYDGEQGQKNYDKVRKLASQIVPGHGRPFVLEEGQVRFVGSKEITRLELYPEHELKYDTDERVSQKMIL